LNCICFVYAANGQRYKKVIGGTKIQYYIDGTVEIEQVNGETITRTYVDDIAVINRQRHTVHPTRLHRPRAH